MELVQRVRDTIRRFHMLPPGVAVVGVSGGADSVALLHILLQLQDDLNIRLHAAHLNHRIRGEDADADQAFTERLAREWQVPLTVGSADVPALARERRLALEEAARQARYTFLLRTARDVGARAVAVAHHADDQAETVLMHFLRGAGLAGMRGILPVSDLTRLRMGAPEELLRGEPVLLVRPLLEVTKADILAYCHANGLEFRFDRSNLDQTYFRNRLRHEVLPTLETYNPNIREVLRRAAVVAADDYALLAHELQKAWGKVRMAEGDGWIEFDLRRWRGLHRSLQRGVLREAIRRLRQGLRNINWIHVENALDVLTRTDTGAATLPQGLVAVARYGRFYVAEDGAMPPPSVPQLAGEPIPVPVPGAVHLPGGRWVLETEILDAVPGGARQNADPWQAWLDLAAAGENLALRPRRPGDTFAPLGMGGRLKRLNEFMINAKIPREWRDNWPLLCNASHILWVAGLRVDERAAIGADTRRVLWVRLTEKRAAHQVSSEGT